MLKKNISFTNFNDEQVTETFYFHISQAELLRLEVSTKGGLQKKLETMVEGKDGAGIMDFIETFIKQSVGRKSEDGSRFNKNQEILDDFVNSPAYDALFMELCTDPGQAAEFLNGIVPPEMAANVERLSKLDQVKANVAARQPKPAGPLAEEREAMKHPEADPTAVEPMEHPDPDTVTDPRAGGNVFKPEVRVLTRVEVQEMDHAELSSGLAEGRYIIGNE